jgi:hypothetical protein
MTASLRARGHRPPVQGGNGRGLTRPQAPLLAALPSHWVGSPAHYKLDLADERARVAVEVDGASRSKAGTTTT